MSNTKPTREEGMKKHKNSQNNVKSLIKDDDEIIKYTWEMSKHSRDNPLDPRKDSVEELDKEIDLFMMYCYERKLVPTMVALSLWLGRSVNTITRWRDDESNSFSNSIKRVTDIFHKIVEQKALDGQINPILYFFVGKNWFGLKDKTEVVHKSQSTQVIDISEQQRILRSTPGVVVDAEFTEKATEPVREPEHLESDIYMGNLENLLRGSENTENLATAGNLENSGDLDTHAYTQIHTDTDTQSTWDDDDL